MLVGRNLIGTRNSIGTLIGSCHKHPEVSGTSAFGHNCKICKNRKFQGQSQARLIKIAQAMIILQGQTISCSLCVWRHPKQPVTCRFPDSGFWGQPEVSCDGSVGRRVSSMPSSTGAPLAWRDCVTPLSSGGLDGLDVVTFCSWGHN